MREIPAGSRYTRVAVALHWIIGAAIVYQIAAGMVMEHLPAPLPRIPVVHLHASLGILVLFLGVTRLAWRFAHPPPPYDPRMRVWEVRLAQFVSVALYASMIAMPLLGWAILSASPRVLKSGMFLFWTGIKWPPLPVISALQAPAMTDMHDRFAHLHWAGGMLTILFLVLHIAGAVRHRAWSFGRMGLPAASGFERSDATEA